MDPWQAVTVILVGWVGQMVKGFKNIPTPLTQFCIAIAAFSCYALATPFSGPFNVWVMNGIIWCLSTLGASSVLGNTPLALKTDQI